MTTGIIIQARMGSTRLPRKVLADIGGLRAIEHTIVRCVATEVDRVILAIPDNQENHILARLAFGFFGVRVFTGPENDVLHRYRLAAQQAELDRIVRITGDCPFVPTSLINRMIQESTADYVSNLMPRSLPKGMDVEMFSWNLLDYVDRECGDSYDREHVTPMMRRLVREGKISHANWSNGQDYSHLRCVLDTQDDLETLRGIADYCGASPPDEPSVDCIIEFLTRTRSVKV